VRGVSACKICFVGDCIAFVQDESFDMDYTFNQVSNRFNQIKNTISVSFHVECRPGKIHYGIVSFRFGRREVVLISLI